MTPTLARPYRPWDVLSLRDGTVLATPLELESVILDSDRPLRRALQTSVWPLGARLITVVEKQAEVSESPGFCQARRRRYAAAADLLWLAPRLTATVGAARQWSRLVLGMTQALASHGVRQVHVSLARDDTVAHSLFYQAGFSDCGADTVYRRDWGPVGSPPPQMIVAEEAPEHREALRALAAAQVRPAPFASNNGSDWISYPLGGWLPSGARRRVCLGRRGEVVGGWCWVPGRAGHWLRVAVSVDLEPETLLRWALTEAQAAALSPRPIYVALGQGQALLGTAVMDEGFEPVLERLRLVKHTTVRVMAPAWRRRLKPMAEVSAPQGADLGGSLHPSTEKRADPRKAP